MERNTVGYLKVILGPMFAGKTSELIRIYNTYMNIDQASIAVINHSFDKRYINKDKVSYIVTHDEKKLPSLNFTNLTDFVNEININTYNVILINEGQFFPDLYVVVDLLVNTYNKKVYVCGLDGDFKRNKFGEMLDIISLADDVVKLKSICPKCQKDALFTHRKIEGDEQTVIGVSIYEPLCRKCYNTYNIK